MQKSTTAEKTSKTSTTRGAETVPPAQEETRATKEFLHVPHGQVISRSGDQAGVSGGNSLTLRLPAGLPGGVTAEALQSFIAGCADAQWFTGKGKEIVGVGVAERARVDVGDTHLEIALLDVKYQDGADLFHVPLVVDADGKLSDALFHADFVRSMVEAVRDDATLRASSGSLRARRTPGQTLPEDLAGAVVKPLGVPQSNVSIKVGDDVMFKAYRKPEAGVPIELEVTSHLTAQKYMNTPQLLGTIAIDTKQSGPMTIGMLFQLVKNDGDGWKTTLSALGDKSPKLGAELALLGTRIGEMHKALGATVDDPAFKPRAITREDVRAWSASIAKELDDTIAAADAHDPALAQKLRDAKPALSAKLSALSSIDPSGMKTRIHGDLHLGQVLKKDGDWIVVDFEGEPARTKEERRGFYTPLRDVAGMLRSFHYAQAEAQKSGADVPAWWAKDVGASFVAAYKEAVDGLGLMPKDGAAFDALLSAVELEKALYEVRYELKSRPAMVDIPASRVLEMAQ